jgi:hypothetical protein
MWICLNTPFFGFVLILILGFVCTASVAPCSAVVWCPCLAPPASDVTTREEQNPRIIWRSFLVATLYCFPCQNVVGLAMSLETDAGNVGLVMWQWAWNMARKGGVLII